MPDQGDPSCGKTRYVLQRSFVARRPAPREEIGLDVPTGDIGAHRRWCRDAGYDYQRKEGSILKALPVLLIVEESDVAELIAGDIDAMGYETSVATSVGDALRLIAQRPYSLIVTNYLGPRDFFPYRWPVLQLLARFAPLTPVLALSMLKEVPRSSNLVGVVRLPDYAKDLAKGLKQYALAVPEGSRDPYLARYLAALWDANADEAAQVVSKALKAGWSGAAIYEDLFTAALYQIREWWESGSCTVADEHGARVITERLMANVSAAAERRSRKGRCIVIGCVEGERHELGARIAADLFDWDGWTVRLMGADTPAAELISEARRREAHVVGLSATMQPSWETIRSQIAELRAAGMNAIIVGGQAFRSLDSEAIAGLGAAAKVDRAMSSTQLANLLAK